MCSPYAISIIPHGHLPLVWPPCLGHDSFSFGKVPMNDIDWGAPHLLFCALICHCLPLESRFSKPIAQTTSFVPHWPKFWNMFFPKFPLPQVNFLYFFTSEQLVISRLKYPLSVLTSYWTLPWINLYAFISLLKMNNIDHTYYIVNILDNHHLPGSHISLH